MTYPMLHMCSWRKYMAFDGSVLSCDSTVIIIRQGCFHCGPRCIGVMRGLDSAAESIQIEVA